jgi:hypothetical protein
LTSKVIVKGLAVGKEQSADPVGGHQVEVIRVQCYHDSVIVGPWEMVGAGLDETVERVAETRHCPACMGVGTIPLRGPGGDISCGKCRGDGTVDGRDTIRAILLATGVFTEETR